MVFAFKDLTFSSTAFDWMAIEAGRMQLTGSGMVNGKNGYGFMLITGKTPAGKDTLRLRVWIKATGQVVYDSLPGAPDHQVPNAVVKVGTIIVSR